MTEIEVVISELKGINNRLERIEDKVEKISNLYSEQSQKVAVLESQRDEVLPEHERFDTRLKSLEVWRAWAIGAVGGAGIIMGSGITLLVTGILKLAA